MPDRISDEELRDKLEIYVCMPAPDELLDLRDARAALTIAVEALEAAKDALQDIEQDYVGNGHRSKEWRDIDTALDRIKGIQDADK